MKLTPYAVAFAMAVALPAAGAADKGEPGKMQPSKAVQALMDNDVKDFFETAASANMLEIEASKLALEQATDPALKDYAQRMVTDHGKASEELKALARQKNAILPTSMLKRHQAMLDDLKDEKGAGFDKEYRGKMLVSHKEAVSLFDEAARKSKDPDVKAFAAKMLPTLQDHGGAAQKLAKAADRKDDAAHDHDGH